MFRIFIFYMYIFCNNICRVRCALRTPEQEQWTYCLINSKIFYFSIGFGKIMFLNKNPVTTIICITSNIVYQSCRAKLVKKIKLSLKGTVCLVLETS